MRNRVSVFCIAFAVLALVLSACGSPTPTRTPSPRTPVAGAGTDAATSVAESPTTVVTTEATVAATLETTVEATTEATTAATEVATEEATEAATATEMATEEATEVATSTPTEEVTADAATPEETETPTATPTEAATMEATATAEVTEVAAATQETLGTQPAELPECRTTGTLLVGTDAAYPPFESVDPATGEIVGFDIELLQAIAEKAGFEVEFRNALFDTIFTALSYGQYDLVISASTITEERQQTVNFSNPYFVAGQVIVVREADANTITTTADLAGKTIGVQLGTTGAEAAKDIPDVAEVKEYSTAPEAFQALSNGTVDAVVNDNVTAYSIILNSPDLNLTVVGQPFTQEYYGIAVRKECTELLEAVNIGLAEVIADGTYAELYAKYFGEEPGTEFQQGGAGIVPTAEATAAGGGADATAEATETAEPTAAPTEAEATATPEATETAEATAEATP